MGKGERLRQQRAEERALANVFDGLLPPALATRAPLARAYTVGRFARPSTPPPAAWLPRPKHHCAELHQLRLDRDAARQALNDVEYDIAQQVARERADGATWSQIGDALAISRQGARQRFGPTE
jgi:hypothetical protein